jgi:hypothetical protein
MESIIHQIAERFIEKVFTNLREDGIGNIGQTAKNMLSLAKSTTCEIMVAAIEQMDLSCVEAKEARKIDGLRIKERNVPREILTDLGPLRYKRTYFETKKGEKCYLVDHLFGVEPYERLSKELCASLVQEASEQSMEKAAQKVCAEVSRQTVNTKVLALKEVVVEAERQVQTPKELHIFADEDHVHMKDGRNAIVPLVTITEGIDTSKKRHKTINPVHFEGYGISNENFFENISSFLNEKYCMEQVHAVYVHADGCRWVQAAEDWIPNVVFVMDGFHLEKRMRQLSHLREAGSFLGSLRKSIRDDDIERFTACCAKLRSKQDERGCRVLADNEGFIRNHWDAMVLRMKGSVCGSCTEPLISHVLSARLSRNPLAWSDHGVRQMAMLRVYVKNGGVVSARDIRVSRKKADLIADKNAFREGFAKYKAYADKQIDAFLKDRPDWSIFEKSSYHYGKLDATKVLLKAYAQTRHLSAS